MYNVSSGINYLMEDIFIHEGLILLYNVEMSGSKISADDTFLRMF